MIIGIDTFGDNDMSVFQTINIVNNLYQIQLSKGIFDEAHMRKNHTISPSSTKAQWQFDTVMLARFQDNLAAGNIDLAGQTIQYIDIKKRKTDELHWNDVTSLPYSSANTNYEYIDKFVEAGEIYEYAIVPVATGGFEGGYIVGEIECEFESTWLFNKNEIYQLLYNLEYGSIDTVIPNGLFEPIGAEYPIVAYNGNLKYRRGNVKCMLISNASANGQINVRQEKLNRAKVSGFLTDRKPKILKDSGGNYILISITGTPRLIPNNDLSQQIYEVDFEFVEVGNPYNETTLLQSGLK